MIVDDEPYNILAMQTMLGNLNIKNLLSIVDKANNGQEALQLASVLAHRAMP